MSDIIDVQIIDDEDIVLEIPSGVVYVGGGGGGNILSTQITDSTVVGRSVLTGTDAAAIRTVLGLGSLATQSGTFSGSSSGTNTGDQDLSGLLVKAANLSDLTSAATARTNIGLELDVVKTWNNAGTVFTGLKLDVTDTASDASSAVLDMQVGGSSKFRVSKSGQITALAGGLTWLQQSDNSTWSVSTAGVGGTPRASWKSEGFQVPADGLFAFTNGSNGNGTTDVILRRDAANTLALRNGTASQTSRIYGTYTDASNYERGFLQADTNGFTIGHESLGTGTKRSVRILGQSLAGAETLSALNILQTWNTSGLPTAIQVNITDTASNAHSVICAMNVNAIPMFRFFKGGVFGPAGLVLSGTSANYGAADYNWWSANGLNLGTNAYLSINDDTYIRRDAADTFAHRRGVNPQTVRIYNTYTDASNYERARTAWESNQFVIGNEYLGTGAARAVALVGGQTGTQGVVKASTGGVLIGAQLNLSNSSNASASTSQIVLYTPAAGQLRITNATSDGFDRLLLGPATASFPMLKRNATAINFRLGDDTADAPITAASVQVSDEVYGASWNGSLQVPTKNALWDKIETISGGGGGGVSAAFVIAMSVAL